MTAIDLSPLTRDELDELMRTAEAAERKAHIALVMAPLRARMVEDAAAVFQDARALLHLAQDESIVRLAAEFDRVFDLGDSCPGCGHDRAGHNEAARCPAAGCQCGLPRDAR